MQQFAYGLGGNHLGLHHLRDSRAAPIQSPIKGEVGVHPYLLGPVPGWLCVPHSFFLSMMSDRRVQFAGERSTP